MIQPRRNNWSSCSYNTESSIFFFFFLHTYMHNTIQYTQLVFDSNPFSSLYKILSKSLDVCNNNSNNHKQAPPLHILSPNRQEHKCANPSKKDNSFGASFFFSFFGFPSTHYQSR
jgi:hypothetical protein